MNDEGKTVPKMVHPDHIQGLLDALGFSGVAVYGVRSTKQAKFEKAPKWVNFWDYAKTESKKRLTKEYYEALAEQSAGDGAAHQFGAWIEKNKPNTMSPISLKLLQQNEARKKYNKEMRNVAELASLTGTERKDAANPTIDISWGDMMAKFPMLKACARHYRWEEFFPQIYDYVCMMERAGA